jgi:hypothetical protein
MTKHKKCQTQLYITMHLVIGQYTNSHGMILICGQSELTATNAPVGCSIH